LQFNSHANFSLTGVIMAKTIQQAIIIGGGIGGLCTAIALRQIGIDVRVYERTEAFERVGAGLAVWANAIRSLRKLDLADQVIEAGSIFGRAEFRSPSGKILQSGELGEFSEPNVGIHRAELHRVLALALPAETLRLGMKCNDVEQDADKVTIHLANGKTDQADCLIAADGLRSTVRQQLFPETQLNYAGRTSWRGVAETRDAVAPGVVYQTWGRGERVGFVSVDRNHVYWFAVTNLPEGKTPPSAERKDFLCRRFRGWHHPIGHLIDMTAAQTIVEAPIYDIEPLARWSQGRITLLGDAAHAATPDMGQGACMAIEDAVVLARCLSQEKDLATALNRYEVERKPRTTWIMNQSRTIGRIAQLDNRLLCTIRDFMLAVVPDRITRRQLAKVIDYEA
jgi:2-polyprenyl-6-methoxyphenol hydroxylase-like FAD-dependent oxidoreductase